MKAATAPRSDQRLLAVSPRTGTLRDGMVADLPHLLGAGDLLVVNDAATLPASLPARGPDGAAIELRLAGRTGSTGAAPGEWWAVAFGAGGWRDRTEDRPAPPALPVGARLVIGGELLAEVRALSPLSPRLLHLRFAPGHDGFWPALYRHGRPVQYAHLQGPLQLWDVQTPYHARPWAVEMPSAGRGLTLPLLAQLRRQGVTIARLTHAAGLSATGDAALDAALPLPEHYELPEETVAALTEARAAGGRVVAVGTTVVRALESAAEGGRLRPGAGLARLRIDGGFRPRVVDGLLTGLHESGTSHFDLLQAFAPPALLSAALLQAEAAGYLGHEFGDAMLIHD